MAATEVTGGIGARLKTIRRRRGFNSTKALADASFGKVTEAMPTNIESGRRSDLQVSQLLNIARALDVPPSMLLAPMDRPDAELDLPNLSADFDEMTAAEFDCWFSATPASAYRPRLAAERNDIETLGALRQFSMLSRELELLQIVHDVQASSADSDLVNANAAVRQRTERLTGEITRLAAYLARAGVSVSVPENAPPQIEKRQGNG